MRYLTLAVAVALAQLFAAGRCAAADPAAELPRYRLTPGEELVYEGSSEFTFQSGVFASRQTMRVLPVRPNADGSWRVVIQNSDVEIETRDGKKNESPADVSLAYVDLYPDGRFTEDPSPRFEVRPARVFPGLPGDAGAMKAGWEEPADPFGGRRHFKVSSGVDSGKDWVFTGTSDSPEDKIYLADRKAVYHFDAARGIITKMEEEFTQGWGFNGRGTGTLELKKTETHDPQWLGRLAREADVYFQSHQAYEAVTDGHERDPARLKEKLDEAEKALVAARDELTLPVFKEQVERQLTKHKSSAEYLVNDAQERAAVVDHPSPDWEATDMAGKPHSLKEYGGKVVVLDFWYRGCGWCIRAMPQIKQLAEDFKQKPVAVLGMNTDREPKDAQFVIDAMDLNYATLKATGLPEKYKVQGFPTLIVIDQAGVIRRVHVGYSPTLRQDVGKLIESLLAKGG